jgi:hypothetical protein
MIRLWLFAAMLSIFSATVSYAQQSETVVTPEITLRHQIAAVAPKDPGIVALPDSPAVSRSPASLPDATPQPNRTSFLLLSASVYSAAFLDMYETKSLGTHVHEYDPVARPFVNLPAPAYYATGAALATGVNWLGWKLAHSRRLQHAWWLPQLSAIAANSTGYGYTITHR